MPLPPRRPPGARGRIGVIQPAPGVMLEEEWPRCLPRDMLFPVGRLRLPSPDASGYDAVALGAPATARDLATAGVGVVAFACTLGSVHRGADAEGALIRSLEAAAGKPAISLGETSAHALRAVGAKRVAILTPYGAAANRWVSDYAEAAGFAVAAMFSTPVGIATVGDLSAAEVARLAIAAMAGLAGADALWIPCTAIRTLDALATIESATGRPAVSGSQALLWRALALLHVGDRVENAGSLFEHACP